MTDAIERIREEISHNMFYETVSVEDIKHLLAEYDRLSDEIVTLQRLLIESESVTHDQ